MKAFWQKLKPFPLIIAFFGFLLVYSVGDCFARANPRDEYENRNLAQFPPFSWKALVTNEWTRDYEEYVQDQFLLRHQWIVLKSVAESALLRTENNNVIYGADGYQFYKFTTLAPAANGTGTQLQQNTEALNRFAARHPGQVTVMVVPSAANILADKLPAGAPLLEENPYLDQLLEALATTAATVDVREAFRAHADEYLYYRTDHHWTTDGAFLAYQTAADTLGLGGFDPAAFDRREVPGFTGTNYNKSLKFDTVPDTLAYYDMDVTLTVKEFLTDGTEYSAQPGPLYDASQLQGRDKYAMFLRGNNGYSTIDGAAANGRRILVIKDSYANCFVPFLTADYEQIDVVDLRYWKYNVENLIDRFAYDDILVLYNFQTFSSETTLFYLNAMVQS